MRWALRARSTSPTLWVLLRGVKTKVHLFTFRLSASGRAVHRAFGTQGQEAFLEGHVYAFDRLGGVPCRHVRYDNLKAAVSRVLTGRNRLESDRWIAFRSHYGFDAFYCQPGVDGAHEKGGVEGEGGRFRRTHCVPMPARRLDRGAQRAAGRRRRQGRAPPDRQPAPDRRPRRAAGAGVAAAAAQRAVPDLADVDPQGRPACPGHGPAVPVLGAGEADRPDGPGPARRLPGARSSTGRRQVAAHERVIARGGQSLILDHYLEVLQRKPGALPGATALAQARAAGSVHPDP